MSKVITLSAVWFIAGFLTAFILYKDNPLLPTGAVTISGSGSTDDKGKQWIVLPENIRVDSVKTLIFFKTDSVRIKYVAAVKDQANTYEFNGKFDPDTGRTPHTLIFDTVRQTRIKPRNYQQITVPLKNPGKKPIKEPVFLHTDTVYYPETFLHNYKTEFVPLDDTNKIIFSND